ncbi:hypothetical protein K5V07_11210 [Flavobacterium sp. CHNK8]|uniref:hypothetical protein n=1 Tax=Flavobacterium sp. CHNK8 TaxID=2871165 RepID=UPI001C8E8C5A|nr:hypothetical protein [Flavobacterium sp. CHNK8]QZK91027.1 hypothetical protein K5V07_11210 [Flavobacterium sp. CHNK8]
MITILNIPYFAGGLSHLIPLYVLHHKYLRNNSEINNQFLVSNNLQKILKMQNINCVSLDYFSNDDLLNSNDYPQLVEYLVEKEKEAFSIVKPSLIIEDTSFTSPLIAEKNDIPRISIQRTGFFRSIDKQYRNENHGHSIMKGNSLGDSLNFSNLNNLELPKFDDSDLCFFQQYLTPKVKIIPGIPTIERLPENIENRGSYFYSGPLIIMDKPSKNLSIRLEEFLNNNKKKPIVFITTGTIDRTPIENFIEFFVQNNYAVITTCNCEINDAYPKEVFYNKLLPLHYICGISNLVIHQCGSGMYHYPIMNRVPSLTLGTKCYDREDIALRLQELGVSGHIPHPDDDSNYWDIFLKKVNKFEQNTLTDYEMIDRLRVEINEVASNFKMNKVIQYAFS